MTNRFGLGDLSQTTYDLYLQKAQSCSANVSCLA
jgi:hypothetical protein